MITIGLIVLALLWVCVICAIIVGKREDRVLEEAWEKYQEGKNEVQ